MINKIPYENHIKARIIDYLLRRLPEKGLIMSEVPFSELSRRVDLLVVANELHAIEIKSERDNLDRFSSQLDDYLSFFERITVFCSKSHLKTIRRLIPKPVGLIVFDASRWTFRLQQPSRKRRGITKHAWLQFLHAREIQKALSQSGLKQTKKFPIEVLRQQLSRLLTRQEMRAYVLDALQKRYEKRFQMFLSERGKFTHTDDVSLLRLNEMTRVI